MTVAQNAIAPAGENETDLVVKLSGFDGPLDLLLSLAHEQKVDLASLSISALAEQYLAYIGAARRLRLEIAADYLVMAAWLAYLKSRLLLPVPQREEPDPSDMAAALRFQLQRLEAMRQASEKLQALPQLGSEIFLQGRPEKIRRIEVPVYHLSIYDLLQSLAAPQRRVKAPRYSLAAQKLFALEEAVSRVRNMVGFMPDWSELSSFVPELLLETPIERRSALASTFAASLELAKFGELVLRQEETFGPIFVRRPDPAASTNSSETAS
ncbi:MAG: segregation/condensation protein A [Alphaproteobacteria bacterium]|nr:segregation/condensation protein A [Alphaproteobacteria bacterium]